MLAFLQGVLIGAVFGATVLCVLEVISFYVGDERGDDRD